ncbi:MAG: hypothetical protein MUE63_14220, partial [Xanthomonadales bacterium]|nr:hypothetical protein [Xanthomonadales bacterium]
MNNTESRNDRRGAGWLQAGAFLLALATATPAAWGDSVQDAGDYREPAPEVTALLTAPTPPEPLLHARSGQIALLFREPVIRMERLARPRLGLAGFRFDPQAGTSGVAPLIYRIELISAHDAGQEAIVWQPPADTVLDFVRFAPDGRTLSALAIGDSGPARLALFDIASGQQRVLDVPVNAAWGEPCRWVANAELLCRVVPGDRGAPPAERPAPVVVEYSGDPLRMRTTQNLLENAYEDALFEYHFSVGLARVDLSGAVRPVYGLQGLISSVEPSPDGSYAMVTRILPPFVRYAPARRFPSAVEVWDLQRGARLYASTPTGIGLDSDEDERGDRRRATWKPDSTNTLGFIDPVRDADGRRAYRWLALSAPFTGEPLLMASSSKVIQRFGWTSAGTAFFVTSGDSAAEVSYQVVMEGEIRPVWKGVAADR